MDSIFPGLQDSHLTFENPQRFARDMKGFQRSILKNLSEMKYSLCNFQTVITRSNIAQILKSWVDLKSSYSELLKNGIGC